MRAYLDSSFLFSIYVRDEHSAGAAAEFAQFPGELVISSLTELEVLNSFEVRVFRKEMTRAEAARIRTALQDDLQTGNVVGVELDSAVFSRAKTLIADTTASVGCRTADILHVAAALELGAKRLLTFDGRQKALARRVKLRTN